MMRIILLLLVTLAGPFCIFTQASTLMVPTAVTATIESNRVENQTDFPAEKEGSTPQDAVSTSLPAPEATEATNATELTAVSTTPPVLQSEAQTDTSQSTEAGPKETKSPEASTVTKEAGAETGKAKETATPSETPHVEVETEGMGTGQLVGIIFGALITVIVVIAIIILVARRMGQYSP